ncbi:hypothetical protein [Komagataeibacter kakiaceti]|uniref:hypothetical protein n=1 Tax=Komagataeibacter kakiaceti TaxID=943261 RepID=UPI000687642E|nr:hypothetical protein [Komagataeibacter kakiaceti]
MTPIEQSDAELLPLLPQAEDGEDWMPVPKARHQRGERPRPVSRGFAFPLPDIHRQTERGLFRPAPPLPVRVSRPQQTKVSIMTKSNANPINDAPLTPSTDGSPTMEEMFMILGGRATDRLTPKSTLRDALSRRRDDDES